MGKIVTPELCDDDDAVEIMFFNLKLLWPSSYSAVIFAYYKMIKKTLENCNLSVFATHEKGAQKKPPTRRKKKKTFPCINVKSSSKHWKKLKSFIAIQE